MKLVVAHLKKKVMKENGSKEVRRAEPKKTSTMNRTLKLHKSVLRVHSRNNDYFSQNESWEKTEIMNVHTSWKSQCLQSLRSKHLFRHLTRSDRNVNQDRTGWQKKTSLR